MKRAAVPSILIAVVLLAVAIMADAQQPKKVPRIGFLIPISAANYSSRTEAFRQGLHELGYVEGKNIVIEYRHAEGKLKRLPELASELVRLKVDIIVVGVLPQPLQPSKPPVQFPLWWGVRTTL
jgi:putative ABC transport system substrate-binding protein